MLIGKYAQGRRGRQARQDRDARPDARASASACCGTTASCPASAPPRPRHDPGRDRADAVCAQPARRSGQGRRRRWKTACRRIPDINVVYTINEPAALGAYRALKTAGQGQDVTGRLDRRRLQRRARREGRRDRGYRAAVPVEDGLARRAARSSTTPRPARRPRGYTDTGVNLITAKPLSGIDSKDVQYGLGNCWG